MKTISNRAVGAAAFAVLAIVGATMNSQKAGAQAPTLVTISSPVPLPIQDVNEPGLTPYQQSENFGVLGGPCLPAGCEYVFRFPAVPAGKRLVIKELSAYVLTLGTGGHNRGLQLNIDSPGDVFPDFPMSLQSNEPVEGQPGRQFWLSNQQTIFFCDPGFAPSVTVSTDSTHPTVGGAITLSGYYVTLPTVGR